MKFFKKFLFRHQSEKRIRMLPEIDGLSKDTVVTSWMAKYDALMKGKHKSVFILSVITISTLTSSVIIGL